MKIDLLYKLAKRKKVKGDKMYDDTRKEIYNKMEKFVEVYVNSPHQQVINGSGGWTLKRELFDTYKLVHNISSDNSANAHYNLVAEFWEEVTLKRRKYTRPVANWKIHFKDIEIKHVNELQAKTSMLKQSIEIISRVEFLIQYIDVHHAHFNKSTLTGLDQDICNHLSVCKESVNTLTERFAL